MRLANEINKRQPFDSLEQEAFLNLLRTSQKLNEEFDVLFKEVQLSPTQYNVLRILRGSGEPIACGRISEMMVTRDPDITRLLDRLEKRGLIGRKRSPEDRRVVLANISAAGMRLLIKLDKPVIELHARQLKHMSKQQLRSMIALLEAARANGQAE